MENFDEEYAKLRDMEKVFIDVYLETFSIRKAGEAASYRYPRPLFTKLFPFIQEKAKRDKVNADFFNHANILNEIRKLYEKTENDALKFSILKEVLALCDGSEVASSNRRELTIKFE